MVNFIPDSFLVDIYDPLSQSRQQLFLNTKYPNDKLAQTLVTETGFIFKFPGLKDGLTSTEIYQTDSNSLMSKKTLNFYGRIP